MAERINYPFNSLGGIFERPEPLDNFARERMEEVKRLLQGSEKYNCPVQCSRCCYGSILMSYTEFNYIILHIGREWLPGERDFFFRERVGLLQDDSTLLCPFLREEADREHCSIYPSRPLICRVFGTTAAPCSEPIEQLELEERIFYQAYDLLYYDRDRFIALVLDHEWALYEAPFALWCLADSGDDSREYLSSLVSEREDSFNAVLYDSNKYEFFTLRKGDKIRLSRGK